MSAVKGAFQCLTKRNLPRVTDHHCGPGDRLQAEPLQTNRQTDRDRRDGFGGEAQHAASLPSVLPVRQITETGRADLGDCESFFA